MENCWLDPQGKIPLPPPLAVLRVIGCLLSAVVEHKTRLEVINLILTTAIV